MTEPNIFVLDDLAPEDVAMLQALYSRSAESALVHLEKVRAKGSGKFMESYYVGYNHKSIGDCGTTTLFFEGVSMLTAKAIQDWALYSGQETSTRYIDMAKQPIIDPVGTPESARILRRWMEFYVGAQEDVAQHIRAQYPRKPDESEVVYDRAVKARTFDILRGWLPAGITTQLSWHTNLRQAADKLALLRYHPLEEVQDAAAKAHARLLAHYPSSFGHATYPETEEYRRFVGQNYCYTSPLYRPGFDHGKGSVWMRHSIEPEAIELYADAFAKRPPKTELPACLADLGNVQFVFDIDFGSFRDIQRHRHGVIRMPLLETTRDFHWWYLAQLPEALQHPAALLIEEQIGAIASLPTTALIRQYYVAMGFRVTVRATWGLPSAVYVMELRSGKLIHPTLRQVVHQMIRGFREEFPLVRLHVDMDVDDWDVRRGKQTILAKS